MPLYTISTNSNIPRHQKKEIAKLIMQVHCGITGAPETFVNVIFSNGVPLNDGISVNILGTVRKGRTVEMSQVLQKELIEHISELMNISRLAIELPLFEVPAQWVMEGGEILPEPGEEDQCEWLQKEHSA